MKQFVHIILLSFTVFSCSEKKESLFFEECECGIIDFSNSIVINDDLGDYSVKFPDSSWLTMHHPEGNGISGSDESQGYLRYFSINELEKANPWPTIEKQNEEIQKRFNVLESGIINYKNQECIWHFMRNDDNLVPLYSLMITVLHPKKTRFFTVNLSVEEGGSSKKRICELESFLDHFIIE